MTDEDTGLRPEGVDLDAIEIEVMTTYLASHSRPEDDHFTFAYTITIANHGDVPVQLLNRYWRITDANQKVLEVRGEGVVGEQPRIEPGHYFRYTSGTNLETPVGYMQGSYEMAFEAAGDSVVADVPITPFSLHTPNSLH